MSSMSDSVKRMFDRIASIPRRRIARWLLVGGALYGIAWLLWHTRAALFPFQIGLVLAYLILPLVNFIDRIRWVPRWLAIFIVYLSGALLFIGALGFVVPLLLNQINQLLQFANNLPDWTELESQAIEFLEYYRKKVPDAIRHPVERELNNTITTIQNDLAAYVQDAVVFIINSGLQVINTVTFLMGFVFIPFWIFYVMHDERSGRAALDRMLPAAIRADFWAIVRVIDRVLSSYIRGQLFLGLIVGTGVGIGLMILNMAGFQVEYVLLLAVFAGVTELIPYVGPTIGATPAVILALFDSPTTAILVALLYMGVQMLENNLLVPRIIGHSVGIHPAVLMVVMVVCSQVLGFVGIILAAPLAAVMRDIFSYVHGRLSEPPRPAGLLPGESLEAAERQQHDTEVPSVEAPPLR